MSMRNDLLKATEDLRRAEADKLQLEGDIAMLKQQVRLHLLGCFQRVHAYLPETSWCS